MLRQVVGGALGCKQAEAHLLMAFHMSSIVKRKYTVLREMLRCTDFQALLWRVTGCPEAAWLHLYSRTRAWHCWDPGRSQCSSLAFVESRHAWRCVFQRFQQFLRSNQGVTHLHQYCSGTRTHLHSKEKIHNPM